MIYKKDQVVKISFLNSMLPTIQGTVIKATSYSSLLKMYKYEVSLSNNQIIVVPEYAMQPLPYNRNQVVSWQDCVWRPKCLN